MTFEELEAKNPKTLLERQLVKLLRPMVATLDAQGVRLTALETEMLELQKQVDANEERLPPREGCSSCGGNHDSREC